MEAAKYFKRTIPEAQILGLATAEENKAFLDVSKVATDMKIGFLNLNHTILTVECEYDGIDNLKKGNEILTKAGFSTDLDTMLRKD